jgi:NitT/TauT family transport system ATP-binding protein
LIPFWRWEAREAGLGLESPFLEVRGVAKVFHVNGSAKTALAGIDLTARRGELICLLGRSGCGKSTLLKILAGFLSPTSGEVRLEGAPILGPGPDRSVIFQEDALFPWLTVEENIAFGLRNRKLAPGTARGEVQRFLDLVGLDAFRDYLPREISGGMKQRVALARVLILRPKVLLMDEPFGALDAQTREEMQGLLLDIWERLSHTIVFVTHDVNEALVLADRVLVMGSASGRIEGEIPVSLARPRAKDHPDFLALGCTLHAALRPS